jgi:RNA-directed DNA polymerase
MTNTNQINKLDQSLLLKYISNNSAKYYYKVIKPKIKFGEPQKRKNNTIKFRHLTPSKKPLKNIQQKICSSLQQIELPSCMYGSIAGSNNIINAFRHIENKYFFKIDLHRYFNRISNTQVNHTFIGLGYSWQEARTLTKLTTYKYALPQGAPTSPVIANLAFAGTAIELQAIADKHNLTLTVYLDDIIFSSRHCFMHLTNSILSVIRANNFFPHHKKICYRHNILDITGLFVGNGKLKIHPEMLKAAQTNFRVRKYIEYVEACYKQYLLDKSSN